MLVEREYSTGAEGSHTCVPGQNGFSRKIFRPEGRVGSGNCGRCRKVGWCCVSCFAMEQLYQGGWVGGG